ncbi:MAG: response regulator [Ruminococcus sp.]|jgi:signal transduction histidine kinase/GGDEF domain-containing protein/ActR/RegA family two-component response regulator|nr:response regulator [Ruminococcus sp.]
MKRRRLFYKILTPLILASVTQAVLFALIVFLSGTPRDINRAAENRFENSLLTAVSLIDTRVQEINPNFAPFAQAASSDMLSVMRINGADMETFMNDPALKAQFQSDVVANLKVLIKENDAAGGFVILSPTYGMPDQTVDGAFPGLFLYHPPTGPATDLVALRGYEEAVRAGGITKSVNWRQDFLYSPGATLCDWMFEPMKAVYNVTIDDINDYIYWSFPFYLREHGMSDAFTAVSVPLVVENNIVGSFGIVFMTSDIMQYDMLRRLDNISLMVASYSVNEGQNTELLESSKPEFSERPFDGLARRPDLTIIPRYTFDSKNIMYPPGAPVTLTPSSEYRGLYYSESLTYGGNPSISTVHDIPVYPEDSPYNGTRWGLTAVADDASVFELSRRLVSQLILIIAIALVATLMVAAFISRTLSNGLVKIVNSINDDENTIPVIDDGTIEIYRLSESLHESSLRYKETISELEEERRRYYIALINSDGSFLDYNAVTDVLYLDTLAEGSEYSEDENSIENSVRHTETEHFLEHLSSGEYCFRDDISDVMKFLRGQSADTITVRMIDNPLAPIKNGAPFRYITGKPNHIYDSKTGKLLRTIACLRDVTEEKSKELLNIQDSRRDKTTGFLRPEFTVNAIRDFLSERRVEEYFAILIFIENYWYFTEKYGRFYSDALISETARLVTEIFGDDNVTSRECTNEFFIIVPCRSASDEGIITADLKLKLFKLIDTVGSILISDEEPQRISLCAGVFYNNTARFYNIARQKSEIAAAAAFKRIPSRHLSERELQNPNAFAVQLYSDVENDYDFTENEDINAILSDIRVIDDYSIDSRDLNTFAFNILEKTADMKSAVQILITRIGSRFNFNTIKVFMFDKNTGTFGCAWRWNKENLYTGPEYSVTVNSFDRNNFDGYMQGMDYMIVDTASKDTPKILSGGLNIAEGSSAAVIPCPAGETFIGCVAFEAEDSVFADCDYEPLLSVVKLLSAFMSKQRSTRESRAKSEFLSKMSHEIRTPMNAILGMTEIALGGNDLSESQHGYLKKIEYSAKYLLTLINDILDMSRIESGKTNIEITDANLDDIILGLQSIIGTQCEAKGITYVVEDNVKHRSLKTDILKLNQILLNLLGNAVKFTPSEGTITLKVSLTEPDAQNRSILTFIVADTGIGIRKERIKKIFEPFEQADETTARQYGGTGLGLPISGSYVALLGGEMDIDSTPGEGTTFTVTIPVTVSLDSSSDTAKSPEREIDFTGKHILIAEDDDLNMEIARTLLEKAGFVVTGAPNGEIALETFIESPTRFFDAILMDIRMPVLNGLAATSKIRALERPDAATIPIIALSANAFAEDIKTSKQAGMNDHIIKPLDMRILLAKLKMYL